MWAEVNRERYASKAKAGTAYRLTTRGVAKKKRAAQSRPFIHRPSEVPGTMSSRSRKMRPIRPFVAPERYSKSTTLPMSVSRSAQNKSRRWNAVGVNIAFCCVPAGNGWSGKICTVTLPALFFESVYSNIDNIFFCRAWNMFVVVTAFQIRKE